MGKNLVKNKKSGFSLMELMIVIAIIAILSVVSIPNLMTFVAKAKRAEAYINLSSLALAQKAYWAEHGEYTNILGSGGLNWKPEGNINYTYGFSGQPGVNNFMGKLKNSSEDLSGSQINGDNFKIIAMADIDGDGKSDILSIDQNNNIQIVQDDLI